MISDHAGWTGYHITPRDCPDSDHAPATEVVVALDGATNAERSLEVADALAAAACLPLRLLAVRPSPADFSSAQSYLARMAWRAPRVSGMTVDIAADAAAALATAADDGALVVLATHARRALGEMVFGSVADQVLQATSRPVLLVGPHAAVPDSTFATMVVPDDGGPGSRALRPWARAWSEHLSSVPWIVQVLRQRGDPSMDGLEAASSVPWTGPALGNDVTMDVLEAAYVESIAKAMPPGAEWEVLRGDHPAERIVDFATSKRAGLIALPVPARHRIGLDVAGGVALQVVRHAPCPVLALGQADR